MVHVEHTVQFSVCLYKCIMYLPLLHTFPFPSEYRTTYCIGTEYVMCKQCCKLVAHEHNFMNTVALCGCHLSFFVSSWCMSNF